MNKHKQFFGRASALLGFLVPAVLLAVLLAACTADTVNINGTYEYKKDDAVVELRLTRGDSNNVTGTQYSNVNNQGWNKDADISGKLEGYEPIKFNYTFRAITGAVHNSSVDVLDYGNKLKSGNVEFIKKK